MYEIGHALGLRDSDVSSAIMYREKFTAKPHPGFYSKNDTDLDQDDIDGIQVFQRGSETNINNLIFERK